MGRTIPSFRLALALEERRWKLYRNALGKQARKEFDDMFAIPRLYISACSYAVQTVRLYPILMSILLNCWIQMDECSKQLEQMADEIGSGSRRRHGSEERENTVGEEEEVVAFYQHEPIST